MIKLEDGTDFEPLPSHSVTCDSHNYTTTWGDLDPIQQLAVESGLDIEGPRCILEAPTKCSND